jgi:tartrate-resistant acid phosphatase type 5
MRQFGHLTACFLAMSFCIGLAMADPTTAPADVNLLSMGDWGTNGPEQRVIATTMANYVHQTPASFDGMLLVGDNFYVKLPGGVDDPMWQSAFEKMYDPQKLNFPFFAVLGNHDYEDGKDATELKYAQQHPDSRWKLPARWYRIDIPKEQPLLTVLMLDSDKDDLGKDRWAQQKTWLDTELAKPRGLWTICCAHHPLFSNGGHGDNVILQNDWGRLFVKYNVDMYVSGHDHDLEHLEIPRWFTSFVIVGGGGAGTTPMRHDDRGPMSLHTHGFGHFDFTPQAVTVRFINDQGRTIHEFTRQKTGEVKVLIEGGADRAVGNPLRALEGFGGYTPPASQPAPTH